MSGSIKSGKGFSELASKLWQSFKGQEGKEEDVSNQAKGSEGSPESTQNKSKQSNLQEPSSSEGADNYFDNYSEAPISSQYPEKLYSEDPELDKLSDSASPSSESALSYQDLKTRLDRLNQSSANETQKLSILKGLDQALSKAISSSTAHQSKPLLALRVEVKWRLGEIYWDQGKLAKGLSCYRQAQGIAQVLSRDLMEFSGKEYVRNYMQWERSVLRGIPALEAEMNQARAGGGQAGKQILRDLSLAHYLKDPKEAAWLEKDFEWESWSQQEEAKLHAWEQTKDKQALKGLSSSITNHYLSELKAWEKSEPQKAQGADLISPEELSALKASELKKRVEALELSYELLGEAGLQERLPIVMELAQCHAILWKREGIKSSQARYELLCSEYETLKLQYEKEQTELKPIEELYNQAQEAKKQGDELGYRFALLKILDEGKPEGKIAQEIYQVTRHEYRSITLTHLQEVKQSLNDLSDQRKSRQLGSFLRKLESKEDVESARLRYEGVITALENILSSENAVTLDEAFEVMESHVEDHGEASPYYRVFKELKDMRTSKRVLPEDLDKLLKISLKDALPQEVQEKLPEDLLPYLDTKVEDIPAKILRDGLRMRGSVAFKAEFRQFLSKRDIRTLNAVITMQMNGGRFFLGYGDPHASARMSEENFGEPVYDLLISERRQGLESIQEIGWTEHYFHLGESLSHATRSYEASSQFYQKVYSKHLQQAKGSITAEEKEQIEHEEAVNIVSTKRRLYQALHSLHKEDPLAFAKKYQLYGEAYEEFKSTGELPPKMEKKLLANFRSLRVKERLKQLAFHKLDKLYQANSGSWSDLEKLAWEKDRAMMDHLDDWLTISDQRELQLIEQTVVMGISMTASMAGGAAFEGLYMASRFAASLHRFKKLGDAVNRGVGFFGKAAVEGLVEEAVSVGVSRQNFRWENVGHEMAMSVGFHGMGFYTKGLTQDLLKTMKDPKLGQMTKLGQLTNDMFSLPTQIAGEAGMGVLFGNSQDGLEYWFDTAFNRLLGHYGSKKISQIISQVAPHLSPHHIEERGKQLYEGTRELYSIHRSNGKSHAEALNLAYETMRDKHVSPKLNPAALSSEALSFSLHDSQLSSQAEAMIQHYNDFDGMLPVQVEIQGETKKLSLTLDDTDSMHRWKVSQVVEDPQKLGHVLLTLEGISEGSQHKQLGKNLKQKTTLSLPKKVYDHLLKQKPNGKLSELSLIPEVSGGAGKRLTDSSTLSSYEIEALEQLYNQYKNSTLGQEEDQALNKLAKHAFHSFDTYAEPLRLGNPSIEKQLQKTIEHEIVRLSQEYSQKTSLFSRMKGKLFNEEASYVIENLIQRLSKIQKIVYGFPRELHRSIKDFCEGNGYWLPSVTEIKVALINSSLREFNPNSGIGLLQLTLEGDMQKYRTDLRYFQNVVTEMTWEDSSTKQTGPLEIILSGLSTYNKLNPFEKKAFLIQLLFQRSLAEDSPYFETLLKEKTEELGRPLNYEEKTKLFIKHQQKRIEFLIAEIRGKTENLKTLVQEALSRFQGWNSLNSESKKRVYRDFMLYYLEADLERKIETPILNGKVAIENEVQRQSALDRLEMSMGEIPNNPNFIQKRIYHAYLYQKFEAEHFSKIQDFSKEHYFVLDAIWYNLNLGLDFINKNPITSIDEYFSTNSQSISRALQKPDNLDELLTLPVGASATLPLDRGDIHGLTYLARRIAKAHLLKKYNKLPTDISHWEMLARQEREKAKLIQLFSTLRQELTGKLWKEVLGQLSTYEWGNYSSRDIFWLLYETHQKLGTQTHDSFRTGEEASTEKAQATLEKIAALAYGLDFNSLSLNKLSDPDLSQSFKQKLFKLFRLNIPLLLTTSPFQQHSDKSKQDLNGDIDLFNQFLINLIKEEGKSLSFEEIKKLLTNSSQNNKIYQVTIQTICLSKPFLQSVFAEYSQVTPRAKRKSPQRDAEYFVRALRSASENAVKKLLDEFKTQIKNGNAKRKVATEAIKDYLVENYDRVLDRLEASTKNTTKTQGEEDNTLTSSFSVGFLPKGGSKVVTKILFLEGAEESTGYRWRVKKVSHHKNLDQYIVELEGISEATQTGQMSATLGKKAKITLSPAQYHQALLKKKEKAQETNSQVEENIVGLELTLIPQTGGGAGKKVDDSSILPAEKIKTLKKAYASFTEQNFGSDKKASAHNHLIKQVMQAVKLLFNLSDQEHPNIISDLKYMVENEITRLGRKHHQKEGGIFSFLNRAATKKADLVIEELIKNLSDTQKLIQQSAEDLQASVKNACVNYDYWVPSLSELKLALMTRALTPQVKRRLSKNNYEVIGPKDLPQLKEQLKEASKKYQDSIKVNIQYYIRMFQPGSNFKFSEFETPTVSLNGYDALSLSQKMALHIQVIFQQKIATDSFYFRRQVQTKKTELGRPLTGKERFELFVEDNKKNIEYLIAKINGNVISFKKLLDEAFPQELVRTGAWNLLDGARKIEILSELEKRLERVDSIHFSKGELVAEAPQEKAKAIKVIADLFNEPIENPEGLSQFVCLNYIQQKLEETYPQTTRFHKKQKRNLANSILNSIGVQDKTIASVLSQINDYINKHQAILNEIVVKASQNIIDIPVGLPSEYLHELSLTDTEVNSVSHLANQLLNNKLKYKDRKAIHHLINNMQALHIHVSSKNQLLHGLSQLKDKLPILDLSLQELSVSQWSELSPQDIFWKLYELYTKLGDMQESSTTQQVGNLYRGNFSRVPLIKNLQKTLEQMAHTVLGRGFAPLRAEDVRDPNQGFFNTKSQVTYRQVQLFSKYANHLVVLDSHTVDEPALRYNTTEVLNLLLKAILEKENKALSYQEIINILKDPKKQEWLNKRAIGILIKETRILRYVDKNKRPKNSQQEIEVEWALASEYQKNLILETISKRILANPKIAPSKVIADYFLENYDTVIKKLKL